MESVRGYFTIERNIEGLTLEQMESKLGFRPGRLRSGARVLVLTRRPAVGESAFAGSTLYSNAKGLVPLDARRNFPGAACVDKPAAREGEAKRGPYRR